MKRAFVLFDLGPPRFEANGSRAWEFSSDKVHEIVQNEGESDTRHVRGNIYVPPNFTTLTLSSV